MRWHATLTTMMFTLAACDGSMEFDPGDAIEVDGLPPSTPSVSVWPSRPDAGTELTCQVDTPAVDPEGARVEYTYRWTVDDVLVSEGLNRLAGHLVDAYTTVRCHVAASDGTQRGGEAVSAVRPTETCRSLLLPTFGALRSENPGDGRFDLGHDKDHGFTLEAWLNLTHNAHTRQGIFGKADATSDGAIGVDYAVWVDFNDSTLHFRTGPEDAGDDCANLVIEAPERGDWFHLAAVVEPDGANSGTKRVFYDGVEVASCDYAIKSPANAGPFVIGSTLVGIDDYANPLRANIDEVRVSRTARYTTDFEPSIYHFPDEDTSALWHFNDGEGLSVEDASKHGTDLDVVFPNGIRWDLNSACDTRPE